MTNPQENVPPGMWQSVLHGVVKIYDMDDDYLINAYCTAKRHDNPKADELLEELQWRNLVWRVDELERKRDGKPLQTTRRKRADCV